MKLLLQIPSLKSLQRPVLLLLQCKTQPNSIPNILLPMWIPPKAVITLPGGDLNGLSKVGMRRGTVKPVGILAKTTPIGVIKAGVPLMVGFLKIQPLL